MAFNSSAEYFIRWVGGLDIVVELFCQQVVKRCMCTVLSLLEYVP